MNIDAKYLTDGAVGGAIIQNCKGEMLRAISFQVTASSSPVEAELKAMMRAVKWADDEGFADLQVESDSIEALELMKNEDTRRWSDLLQ
ncbi:unnamed protein product [Cuscuta epithymum]|uniref:RNase H type-1 domain-containing protein n=1 Tax=Cuscuta epithymum TaxID=186058 RepID=A0AAV0E950_9ASTE|nr:unnamed protein product [Cuscuta epithymum]